MSSFVIVSLTALPLAPSSPGGPLAPGGPAAPGGPVSPFSPWSPLSPCVEAVERAIIKCGRTKMIN